MMGFVMDATSTSGPAVGRRGARVSAGLLMYREGNAGPKSVEVFIVHPGGPFFARRDLGIWTIPKGLVAPGEDLIVAAQREFEEETGLAPTGPYVPLGSVVQANRKTVHAWAFAGDWDPARPLRANTFEIEWPPRSGRIQVFPEADRGEFVTGPVAEQKLIPAQRAFLARLEAWLTERR
jgi:predicted NUDIX family NTP pyrophosphohydrolase